MTTLSVADVLDRAADLIEPEGAWTTHVYEDLGADGQPCSFCVAGSVLHALGLSYDDYDIPPGVSPTLLGFETWGEVMDWNDRPDRTQAEVVAKLREAATLSRSSENRNGTSHG